jgi:hypothetical protein
MNEDFVAGFLLGILITMLGLMVVAHFSTSTWEDCLERGFSEWSEHKFIECKAIDLRENYLKQQEKK